MLAQGFACVLAPEKTAALQLGPSFPPWVRANRDACQGG